MLRLCLLAYVAVASASAASEYRGQISFGKVPVPGALVMLTQGTQKLTAVTDSRGAYQFTNIIDGTWSLEIQMTCFARIKQDVVISSATAAGDWQLHLLPLEEIQATAAADRQSARGLATRPTPEQRKDTNEGLLINGSTNNGAASIFGQAAGFGNNRSNGRSLYNGGLGLVLDNSTFDAKPYSLTGQDITKPSYNRLEGLLSLGGPLRIPHILRRGPDFVLNYQWTRGQNVTTQPALVPTAAQRSGVVSLQAKALLALYPLPNFTSGTGYNYQTPLTSNTHQDGLQTRVSETLGRRDQVSGNLALQSIRMDASTLFRFLDVTDSLGLAASANWTHEFNDRLYLKLGYQFSRYSVQVKPYFAARENISGAAGISGNNQEPANWGPPALTFASGIASLSDVQSSNNHNQTDALSYAMSINRQNHNILFGGDFRHEQFNVLSQQDPRGTFTFTGAATGSDFGDFSLGIPDTSSIAFGNADKYFRESVYDLYATDDWRVGPSLTVNAGLRWDYGAPVTELYNRLVNLDFGAGFSAAAPVTASDPAGSVSGQRYPQSLLRPDRSGFEPRIGVAWRPLSGSSLVIRAGYGIYYNTSVYQSIALQMAQQPPLSKTLRVENSSMNPLTLADGFSAPAGVTANTFAVDPNFRVGYAQNWQVSVQRDLAGSLQMTATYLGIKGTHATQDFLPNTYPVGSANPCPACPAGFSYLTSNADSSREAATIQLRRRLHSGLTATLQYTFSKAIDNAAVLGGGGSQANGQSNASSSGSQNSATSAANPLAFAIAQNWLDLNAERGLSTFDQRHLLNLVFEYTTGMGLRGGTLLSGWRGALFKEWTFGTDITASSGLPLTPVYLTAVPGTGVTGTIRPDYTGALLYSALPAGNYLNPGAYVAPPPGQWGNAGRNTIEGPSQFSLNASLGRTFRLTDHFNLDVRLDATNALNHVNFTAWGTTINSPQFGLPVAANAMRSVQTTVRLRF